ncbi:hypothetical protein V498_08242 [Pseudogymnoascus sp. VKM F-4517 (FW-2822)]|nr:hypothetical protein V498_08242 [Pseudogymnoascus sp. VKM F-4517 (FW-2822)]
MSDYKRRVAKDIPEASQILKMSLAGWLMARKIDSDWTRSVATSTSHDLSLFCGARPLVGSISNSQNVSRWLAHGEEDPF